jgi:hypothetical protein
MRNAFMPYWKEPQKITHLGPSPENLYLNDAASSGLMLGKLMWYCPGRFIAMLHENLHGTRPILL